MQRKAIAQKKPVVSAPSPMPKRSPSKTKLSTASSSTANTRSSTTAPALTAAPPSKKPGAKVKRSSHSSNDANLYAMVPCRYFMNNGHCPQGNQCRYSHNPEIRAILTDPTLMHGDSNIPTSAPVATPSGNGSHPDIDSMSYEDLLNLCERLGKVTVGVSTEKLARIPTVKVRTATSEHCSVCLEGFSLGDEMKLLPCDHPFHPDCIDEWLKTSQKCPNCNANVSDELTNACDVLSSLTRDDQPSQRTPTTSGRNDVDEEDEDDLVPPSGRRFAPPVATAAAALHPSKVKRPMK